MDRTELSQARNPKLQASLAAITRAADLARRTAIQTETGIVVVMGGKRMHISADQLRRQSA